MSESDVEFDSFEEFEREFLPQRHATRRVTNPWTPDRLASELAQESLASVTGAIERASSRSS